MNMQKTKKMVSVSILSAISFVLYILMEFPLLPFAPWLKMDFSDVAAIIGGVVFGPLAGVTIEFIKNFIQLMVKGFGTTAGLGNLMNFIVGSAFVVPISMILKKSKVGVKQMSIGFLISSLLMLLTGFVGNLITAPYYLSLFFKQMVTFSGALNLALLATAFNIIKAVILIVITGLLIKFVLPKIRAVVDKY